MAWYLNGALTRFRAAVNAVYPRRDKTSDGTIGDEAHQAGTSDHNKDADGSVDAWDMDVDLHSADNAAAIERLKAVFQAHPSSRYWIHNRRIASRSDGWVRRYYDGDNPHDKHIHWNTRESHEESTAPWPIEGEAEMALSDKDAEYLIWRVDAIANMREVYAGGPEEGRLVPHTAAIKALAKQVAEIDYSKLAGMSADALLARVVAAGSATT